MVKSDTKDWIKASQGTKLTRVESNDEDQQRFFLAGFGVERLTFITVGRRGWATVRNSHVKALTIKAGYKDIELPPRTQATLTREKTKQGFGIVFGANEAKITWEQLD